MIVCNFLDSYACNTETTVSSDRGTFEWPVTTSGSVANVSCPSGPTGANATRICTNDNTWESPNITSCATTRISNEFRNISNVIKLMYVAMYVTTCIQ